MNNKLKKQINDKKMIQIKIHLLRYTNFQICNLKTYKRQNGILEKLNNGITKHLNIYQNKNIDNQQNINSNKEINK